MSRLIRATAPDPPPSLVTLPNVEIIEVGEDWETSTGLFTFDEEDLISAVESQQDPAVRTPVLKLGHTDPRSGFDGQPAFGRLENLRITNNGQTLVTDIVGMPRWLASIVWSAYPRRSFEGQMNFSTRTGNTWPLVVEALSLLGAAYPAINTLEDLKQIWGSEPPPLYPAEEVEGILASEGSKIHARKVDEVKWKTLVGGGGSGNAPTDTSIRAGGSIINVKLDGKTIAAGATTFGDLPLADRERAWSKTSADTAVRAWASSDGSGDTDKIDWAKYRKAFFWYDSDNAEQFGSYKLMFADVEDGTLTAIPRGIFAAAAVIQGSRGGVDIPSDDEASVKNLIAQYYTKMAKKFDDDTITPPWEVNSSMKKRNVKASTSLDDVRMAYYDSLDSAQMWWWIRQVLVSPLQLVVDDDEGGLYMVDATVENDGSVSFGEPTPIKVEYVAAAKSEGVARPGQIVASEFSSAEDAGGRPRATIPPVDADEQSADSSEEENNSMKLTPEALASLGLAADASDADISAAIIARGQQAPSGEGAPTEPETPAEPEQPEQPEQPATPPATLTIPDGMELMDAATAQEMRELVAAGRAEREKRENEQREQLIGDAVRAGKFPRARVEHYTNLYKADPEGTRQLLASLAPGVIPVVERGTAGETDPTVEASSYPKSWEKTVAATAHRAGAGTRVKVGND